MTSHCFILDSLLFRFLSSINNYNILRTNNSIHTVSPTMGNLNNFKVLIPIIIII